MIISMKLCVYMCVLSFLMLIETDFDNFSI